MSVAWRALSLVSAGCFGGAQAAPLGGEHIVTIAFSHDYMLPREARPVHLLPTVRAEFDTAGMLRRFSDGGEVRWPHPVGHAGNDGIIAWGRWGHGSIGGAGHHGGYEITGGEGVRNALYYVAGLPSGAEAPGAEPGPTPAHYAVLGGAVAPSAGEGGMAAMTLLEDGSLTVDAAKGVVAMTLTITVPYGTYTVRVRDMPLRGSTFATDAGSAVNIEGIFCFAGCRLDLRGFLAGPAAERAGLAYRIEVESLSQDPSGVVAWTRRR